MPEWTYGRESEVDVVRASARLPGLDLDIIHRQSPNGDWEQMSINLLGNTVLRSARVLVEAANPFTFWVQATRFMWMPWLLTAQTMMLPAGRPRTLPSAVHPPSARGADGLGDPFFHRNQRRHERYRLHPSSQIDPGKNLRPYLFMRPASDQNSEVLKAHTNFSRIFDDPHVRGRHCINERFD
jgi:hypothetical protein